METRRWMGGGSQHPVARTQNDKAEEVVALWKEYTKLGNSLHLFLPFLLFLTYVSSLSGSKGLKKRLSLRDGRIMLWNYRIIELKMTSRVI